MRLIDADANRDDFMAMVYDILSDETDNIKANLIIDAFDGMQTAYDPDKVVERLQDVACRIDTHRIDDTNALSAIDIIDEDDLIEIVKSGGIDT